MGIVSSTAECWKLRDPQCARSHAARPVPILTYHSLDDSGSVISMPPTVFREQIRLLRKWGFHGITLSELLDGWNGSASLLARPVVITFDDGYRNVLTHAVPTLKKVGFRATIFAVAGRCGGWNDWPNQPIRIPKMPLLSWPELSELVAAGFEIASHGLNHARLTECTRDEAEQEIAESKQVLERRLDQAVRFFAYPYGAADAGHRAFASRHYEAACGADLRFARSSNDRLWLDRVEMYYFRQSSAFRLFPTPACGAYLAARSLGRLVRSQFDFEARHGNDGAGKGESCRT